MIIYTVCNESVHKILIQYEHQMCTLSPSMHNLQFSWRLSRSKTFTSLFRLFSFFSLDSNFSVSDFSRSFRSIFTSLFPIFLILSVLMRCLQTRDTSSFTGQGREPAVLWCEFFYFIHSKTKSKDSCTHVFECNFYIVSSRGKWYLGFYW